MRRCLWSGESARATLWNAFSNTVVIGSIRLFSAQAKGDAGDY